MRKGMGCPQICPVSADKHFGNSVTQSKPMNHLFALLAFTICFITSTQAQNMQKLHFTADVSETNQIQMNFGFPVEIIHWEGNNLMVETQVETPADCKHIVAFFMKEGRYTTINTSSADQLTLENSSAASKPLLMKGGKAVQERVKIIVYVPMDFELSAPTTLTKKTAMPVLASSSKK